MRPTAALARSIRRLQLTTKQVNGGYYKGTGSGSMGRHTKHGGYIIDWNKVRTYVVPEIEGFTLTPFVTMKLKPTKGRFEYGSPLSGEGYLARWKAENGEN
ncbi:60S ribosomal protein L27, mitochondrial [Rhizina undulata]